MKSPDQHRSPLRSVAVVAAQRLTTASVTALVEGVAPERREMLRTELSRQNLSEAVVASRADEATRLVLDDITDNITGLAPTERLGPFPDVGGRERWFDLFLPAQQLVVRIDGESAPAYVLTNARVSVIGRGRRSVRLDPGTVWIRADLMGSGFPAGSYVGINHAGGTVRLGQQASVAGSVLDVVSPFLPALELAVATDTPTPAPGACTSAAASVALPAPLTLAATASGWQITGTGGSATAWGQTFAMTFPDATAPVTFLSRLWAAVVPCETDRAEFDPGAVADDLIRLDGAGVVSAAALTFPVVQVPDPSVLGTAARGGEWLLTVEGLQAEWYDGDLRRHALASVRVGISGRGAFLLADGVPPLVPALSHSYDLWAVAGHPLPWRNQYAAPFGLWYRCDVVDGETLLLDNGAALNLDRPVTTDGAPLRTPISRGTTLLQRIDGTTRLTLAGLVGPPEQHQFALRNALVWTRAPAYVLVKGALLDDARTVRAGEAEVPLPVLGWAPFLPDPYVSNATLTSPAVRDGGAVHAVMVARIRWAGADAVTVSFEGSLGTALALERAASSANDPRPARRSQDGPAILTQAQQHEIHPDRAGQAAVKQARAAAGGVVESLLGRAREQDDSSRARLDETLREAVGGPASVLLLDVSTNEDLLGVGIAADGQRAAAGPGLEFSVIDGASATAVSNLRVVALPQVQWEPVRTLDDDQDILTLGWFPTPLASASDGGPTHLGARSQKLRPVTPSEALAGTVEAFRSGARVGLRTTFPFGLVAAIDLRPDDTATRLGDMLELTRPDFALDTSRGGIQITARAEGGRPDLGGVSPTFQGVMRQLLNGVDLVSGSPQGLSVLGSTADPLGSVETVFNADLAARPRVPVTRVDISGYGGSSFSDWNNPFAAFSEAAKVQFRYLIGRTAVEVVKVNTVLHPWGIRVTRSVTVERRPGGGVIRRDSGWQAFTPGLFDYRYFDTLTNTHAVADYRFDTGVFRGFFDVRSIRPAPGVPFSSGASTLLPYYFDADVALEGVTARHRAVGVLGYLQTRPNGAPAPAAALRALIVQQGPVGGPVDVAMSLGASGVPFRAQRVEVGLADDAGTPVFVTAVRGAPALPRTGAWSMVHRPVAAVPAGGGEAVPVGAERGVPLIRRNEVRYTAGDLSAYAAPPTVGAAGDHRLADPADLLTPNSPANDYALLQSTSCHALLFPRPVAPVGAPGRLQSGHRLALADVLARSTSKGAFPPPASSIELAPGAFDLEVGPTGTLALSTPIDVVAHPTPLRIAGTPGHGSTLRYDSSTLHVELGHDRWAVDFTGLRLWSDIAGLSELTGTEMRIVGSTDQRPQIATMRSMLLDEIEQILSYIPLVGARGTQGPVDLGASNATHELKFEAGVVVKIPLVKVTATAADPELSLELSAKSKSGLDLATSTGLATGAELGIEAEGRFPVLTVGVASVFIVVSLEVKFSLVSVSGTITAEKLELTAFAGVGVKGQIGPFEAYAFLGIGFVLEYDVTANQTKYGGLVALEAGVDLKIVNVTIRAELKGLVYDDAGSTKCDYGGSVEINVEIFVVISISATYEVTETTTL